MSKLVKVIVFFFVYLVVALALVIIFDQLGLSNSSEGKKITNSVKKNIPSKRRIARGANDAVDSVKNVANNAYDGAVGLIDNNDANLFEPEKVEIPEVQVKQVDPVMQDLPEFEADIGDEISIEEVPEFDIEEIPAVEEQVVTAKQYDCFAEYTPSFNNKTEEKTYFHGLYFIKKNDRPNAAQKFLELVRMNDSVDFKVNLAWNLILIGKKVEAAQILKSITTVPNNQKTACHFAANLGHLGLVSGNSAGAVSVYKELNRLYESAEAIIGKDFMELNKAYPNIKFPKPQDIR